MKKLLLLFAVLLSTVGTWAQTFTLLKSTNVENPEHQYLMKNGNDVFMDSQTSYVSGEKVNGRFAFFAYGGNDADVLIYSIDAQKWVSYEIAASYDNKRDFACLIDSKEDAKPWRFSLNENTGVPVYQFAPHNTTNVASKYMNWYEGTANNKVQNSVGLYSSAANSDAGSAWSLWPLTSQMCYLRDVRNNYLNLNQLGQDANGYENTLATLTTVPVPLYVNVAIDGRWQIHTSVDGGNYLKQSSWKAWNSQVTEGSGDYYWTIEYVNADGVKCLVLKNTSGNENGYLGNDNHTDGTPLYVNTNKDSQGVKLLILDAETEFAHIIYSLDYKGENKGVEEYYSPIGKKFPKLLYAKDYIYPVMPSGNVEALNDGRVCKINLVDNLPFQTSESYEEAKWYYMVLRGNASGNNSPKWIAMTDDQPYSLSSNKTEGDKALWAFVGNPFDGIKVLNRAAGNGKTLNVDGSNVIMQDGDFSWTIQEGNGGFVLLQEMGTNKYVHDFSSKLQIWNNGSAKGDNGSAFTVKDVDAWGYPQTVTVGAKITDLSTITEGQMVVFKVADKNRYLTLTRDLEALIRPNAEGLSVFRLHRNGTETNQFTIESERDGYYFPNINNTGWPDYYMTNEGTPNVYQFKNATSDTNDGKFFIGSTVPYSGTTYGWFDSDDGNFTGWQGSGANATYEIYSVTVSAEAKDINQITQTAILTDIKSGDSYQSYYLAFSGLNPTISGIPSNFISNATLNNNVYTADVTFPFPVSTEGGVLNATMISSFNTSAYKWYASGDRVKNIQNERITNSNVATHLWTIYPAFKNSSFSFTIKNLSNGKFIEVLKAENDHSGDEVGLSANASAFTFENNRFKYSTGHFLSTNSSNKNDGFEQYVGTHNSTGHTGSQNRFDIPEYAVDITSAKAATLYTPVAVTIPDGVTAKYVKAEGENMGSTGKLVYTKLNDVIPANSAVVLTGEAGNYTFTATTEAGEEVADNVLFGYATETAATDNTGIYALANKTNGVAFYPFVGTTYKAGKAYLNISGLSASEVRFFNIFDEDIETSIDNIEGAESTANAVVYDLAGRRVQNAQKGLYIVNGKKVIK